ncbi:asparaginase domain-containing protein [Corynebacterium sp. MNWGS58]|uniref:asparaginase domain-containing protein n=1 Tax=Corynebacterium sp. 102791.4 TaxID=3104612 RepID=UPI0035184155
MTRHIAIICTGGTIACTADDTGALVPTVSGHQLVDAAVPALDDDALDDDVRFRILDTLQLDSSSIGLAELDTLLAAIAEQAADPSIAAVVVTHGTDSMEESAFATALLVRGAPVVFTGAQRAFDHPATDGPRNLAGAINRAVELADARADAGSSAATAVEVHFAGKNLPGHSVHKRHTAELAAFASHAHDADCTNAYSAKFPAPVQLPKLDGYFVPIIAGYPGATAELVDYAVEHHADGLVIEALGSGNMSADLGPAVVRALERGVPVVVATRVPQGAVALAYGGGGGGATLAEHGAVSARTVHPGQARLALISALATGTAVETVFQLFD